MTGRQANAVLAIWGTAFAASILAVLLAVQVAPCLGSGGGPEEQDIRNLCVMAWLAERSLLDRFISATPNVIVVVLALAMLATAVVLRPRRPMAWVGFGVAAAVLIGVLADWPDTYMDQLMAHCGTFSGGGPEGNPAKPWYCRERLE